MYLPARLAPLPFFSPLSVGPIRAIKLQAAYLRQLQQLCDGETHLTGLELVAALLAHLEVRVLYSAADLRALPATGAFLALTTQPGSLLNRLVLLHVLGQARPEVRALLSEALTPPLPLLTHCLALDPTADDPRSKMPGWRRLLRLLHNEVPVAIMADANAPQGATFSAAAERLLSTLRVPVVPIGLSSRVAAPLAWWQTLPTLLYPLAGVASELLSERGTTFRVRFGPAVRAAVVQNLPVAARLPYLQAKAEALRGAEPVAAHPPLAPAAPLPAPAPADYRLLEADLAALRPQCRVVQCRQWEVYVAKGSDIPQVLREIRRLRALTLEPGSVGKSAAGQQDLADASYRHLFIYNRRARQLVGACRLGHGKSLLQRHGRRGFQLCTPFKLQHELHPLLQQALELSQAFVCPDYQGQLLPLGLLWEGLAQYLRGRPQYRYLLGSMNLSHCYASLPKATVAEFIQRHCLASETAAYVRVRRPFRYQELPGLPRRAALADDLDHEQLLHDLLAQPEPGGLGVPPRLRPYFRQQARFIGLHLDPASGALHGALVLDASKLADYTYRLGGRDTQDL